MEAYHILERYHILPSQYLGLSKGEYDPQAERAFLLACALKTSEAEKKQAKKMKQKHKSR